LLNFSRHNRKAVVIANYKNNKYECVVGPIKLGQKNKNLRFLNKAIALWGLSCVLLCFFPRTAFSQAPLQENAQSKSGLSDVNSVRLWHSPDKTRIVFDVSDNIDYTIFSLKEPERLVVDIKNSTQKATLPKLEADNKHISQIRFGAPKAKVLRFVFDLKRPLEEHSFLLTPNELYGHRLVLDLLDLTVRQDVTLNEHAEVLSLEQDEVISAKPVNIQDPITADVTEATIDYSPEVAVTEALDSSKLEEPARQVESVRAPIIIKPRTFIVAIDAGHGGEDPGALGHRGSREKVITLSIAKRLKKVIDADARMQAILIRTGDYYIDLQQRRLTARAKGADIFLSIHADAFTKRSANGLSVFALSQRGATSAMARALAAKENASDLIGGVSLANKDVVLAKVLVDLSMTNTISESVNLGGRVLKELGKVGRLHSKRVEQASFAVLKSPDMPSILIETGFITNLEEERKLRSASYQKKIVNGIYNALSEYHDQTPYYSQSNYASPVVRSGPVSSASGQSRGSSVSYHKVKRGDSLSLIASKYGMSLKELKRINGLRRNTAVLGQRLKVNKSASAVSKETAQKVSRHTVKRGESLSLISAKYNVTIAALKSINGLSSNSVRVGQKIKLPSGTTVKTKAANRKHTVKRGDTLSEIAEQYGVTINTLMKANSMRTRTVLLGQRLSIPN
jgi:N-acetylmuramoyl-L-alanine amidase